MDRTEQPKKNDKNAMIAALQERNSTLVSEKAEQRLVNAELRRQLEEVQAKLDETRGQLHVVIEQRDGVIAQRNKALAKVDDLKGQLGEVLSRDALRPKAYVRNLAASRPAQVYNGNGKEGYARRKISQLITECQNKPRGQADTRARAIVEFLKQAYSCDVIKESAEWLAFSLCEKGYTLEETRDFLESNIREGGSFVTKNRCERDLLDLMFAPEEIKTDVGEEQAAFA